MKLYISGPITGQPNGNRAAFEAAEEHLKTSGHEVVNPHKLFSGEIPSWIECMKVDIKALVDCDGIYMLDGWSYSRGAIIEHYLATMLGLKVYSLVPA